MVLSAGSGFKGLLMSWVQLLETQEVRSAGYLSDDEAYGIQLRVPGPKPS